jgi:hypothetical protein
MPKLATVVRHAAVRATVISIAPVSIAIVFRPVRADSRSRTILHIRQVEADHIGFWIIGIDRGQVEIPVCRENLIRID